MNPRTRPKYQYLLLSVCYTSYFDASPSARNSRERVTMMEVNNTGLLRSVSPDCHRTAQHFIHSRMATQNYLIGRRGQYGQLPLFSSLDF